MEYFYARPEFVTPEGITIDGEEFSHMRHVMRGNKGDTIRVVDGTGNSYEALIEAVTRTSAHCTITASHPWLNENERELTLGAGMLKNPSRFDYLVEKAVEIGVARIVPLLTQYTIPRSAKRERWQKLCIAAMKQSGRCVLPEVGMPVPFAEFIGSRRADVLRLIPHEQAGTLLGPEISAGNGPAVVCIGPEGGFSDSELSAAVAAGFRPVSLGERRLRTETAAVVACASILHGTERTAR